MPLNFDPPLLNTACAWATDFKDLRSLYECPYTGAITIRTCTLNGFKHDDNIHQYCFFGDQSHEIKARSGKDSATDAIYGHSRQKSDSEPTSSLNTYGYSPLPLGFYVHMMVKIIVEQQKSRMIEWQEKHGAFLIADDLKPVIFSVTGRPTDMPELIRQVGVATRIVRDKHGFSSFRALMEINLSCPNIAGAPPPAYAADQLQAYLAVLDAHEAQRRRSDAENLYPLGPPRPLVEFGLKLPPYTYQTQFDDLIGVLQQFAPENTTTTTITTTTDSPPFDSSDSPRPALAHPITFLTSTNTLGTALVLSQPNPAEDTCTNPALPALSSANGSGIGGLGGPALHPLTLGNIRTLRRMLDAAPQPSVRAIEIIGVGGVSDSAGYARMQDAGAAAVGVATCLGWRGINCFKEICPPDLVS